MGHQQIVRSTLINLLRELPYWSKPEVANEIGVSKLTLIKFLDGKCVYFNTLAKIESWINLKRDNIMPQA